jgi:hypothetical protein
MQNVTDLFALWPSDADLGRDIGVPYPTVSAWKQRGSIPTSHWPAIIRAASKRGYREVTADLLLSVHTPVSDLQTPGFKEDEAGPFVTNREVGSAHSKDRTQPGDGHFSRHKHLRRNRFRTAAEIEDHLHALRDEWSHR